MTIITIHTETADQLLLLNFPRVLKSSKADVTHFDWNVLCHFVLVSNLLVPLGQT